MFCFTKKLMICKKLVYGSLDGASHKDLHLHISDFLLLASIK